MRIPPHSPIIGVMEHIVETRQPTDFIYDMNESLISVSRLFSNFIIYMRHQRSSHKLDAILPQIGTALQTFSCAESWLVNAGDSPAVFQACIAAVWGLRSIHHSLSQLRFMFESTPLLSKKQLTMINQNIEDFVETFIKLDLCLAKKANFPITDASLKNCIGHREISAPLRILIEDDDTGKHISCFELPQVYGFGETEKEALEMLDREIVSLYADLQEGIAVSKEYEVLKIFLDMVFCNEEYAL